MMFPESTELPLVKLPNGKIGSVERVEGNLVLVLLSFDKAGINKRWYTKDEVEYIG